MVEPVNVLIADGRKLMREGLSALVERGEGFRVVGEADDGPAAVRLLGPLGVRVLVLNVGFPTLASVELLRELARGSPPEVKFVALTSGFCGDGVRDLLAAGATACLARDSASDELLVAIRSAADGRTYLSPALTDALVTRVLRRSGRRPLSRREREILRLLACGQSTKEIAVTLGLGAKTIETHRRRMMEKLALWSVAELTRYAIAQGLVGISVDGD